jgi:hypothetical protein
MNLSTKDLKCRDLLCDAMNEMLDLSTPRGLALRDLFSDPGLTSDDKFMLTAFFLECGPQLETAVEERKWQRRARQLSRVYEVTLREHALLHMPVEGHA